MDGSVRSALLDCYGGSARDALETLMDDVAGLAAYIALHTAQIAEREALLKMAARWGKDFPQDG